MPEKPEELRGLVESHERTLRGINSEVALAHDRVREAEQKIVALNKRLIDLEGRASGTDKDIIMLRRILTDMKNVIETWLKVYK